MNQLSLTATISGEYKFLIKKSDGTIKETEWIPNLIVNGGLDRIGNSPQGVFSYCRVGTGNSTPVATQNALDAQIATSASLTAAQSVVNEGAPLYRTLLTHMFTFAQGAVVGTISEVGVGWATSGASLFSRALILNSEGVPTTISLVALDQLIVYYRLRVVPPVADATGSVVLNSITYNYTTRVAEVGTFGANASAFNGGGSDYIVSPSQIFAYAAGATLGPITGLPSGTSLTAGTAVKLAYTAGSYYRDTVWTFSISQGNGTGIQLLRFVMGSPYQLFTFQMRFDTPIPKTNTNVLSLTTRFAWARA